MPLLKIQTNIAVSSRDTSGLLKKASSAVASMLGKPESYVMVVIESGLPISFAGSDSPAAYLELKSIGLPGNRTAEFSATLCKLLQAELGLTQERIYIEFADAPRHLWGWNGGTF